MRRRRTAHRNSRHGSSTVGFYERIGILKQYVANRQCDIVVEGDRIEPRSLDAYVFAQSRATHLYLLYLHFAVGVLRTDGNRHRSERHGG